MGRKSLGNENLFERRKRDATRISGSAVVNDVQCAQKGGIDRSKSAENLRMSDSGTPSRSSQFKKNKKAV